MQRCYLQQLLLISVLFCAEAHTGEIYKWVDDEGKLHFSDQDPKRQNSEEVTATVKNTFASTAPKDVTLYATAWCGYCKKARAFFKKHAIAYTEFDIEKDSSAKARYDAMGASGIPVIFINGKRFNGFNEAKLEKALLATLPTTPSKTSP